MCNNSQSLVPFRWDQVTTPNYVLLVEPGCGELTACSELCCELNMSASAPGSVDADVVCHLGHVDQILSVHVGAVVGNSELSIDDAEIDFAMIRFGDSATRPLTIRNPGRSVVEWTVQLSAAVPAGEADVDEFRFCPSAGTLLPLDACTVEVMFHPKWCRSVNTLLEVTSADGFRAVIGVTADVQHPEVCLLKSSVHLTADLDVKSSCDAVLFNQTALSTTFEWGEPVCNEAARYDVEVEPRSGTVAAREKVTVSVGVTAHGQGPISFVVPCRVAGMDQPLRLSVSATVRDLLLAVTYSVSSDRESWLTGDGVIVDFGGNNLLHDTPTQYLRIYNRSGISTHFWLAMETFPSALKEEKSKEESGCDGRPARLLKKTANLADPTAKTDANALKDMRAKILAGGAGVAFRLEPSAGELAPFSEVIVEIMACADHWGFYSDMLLIYVGELDFFSIPVSMSVIDSPVLFQMVSHQPAQVPIVRFGCVVEGKTAVTRRTRILNRSPQDIRVDWQTFNIVPDDRQLVDLVVTFGKPFPLKNKNGQEIILRSDDGTDVTEDDYKKLTVDEAAVEELAASRPQLISLNMREHHGMPATEPYSIEPSQLVRTAVFLVSSSMLTLSTSSSSSSSLWICSAYVKLFRCQGHRKYRVY